MSVVQCEVTAEPALGDPREPLSQVSQQSHFLAPGDRVGVLHGSCLHFGVQGPQLPRKPGSAFRSHGLGPGLPSALLPPPSTPSLPSLPFHLSS